MADRSRIEWTDSSWNPVRGCSRVSEGCRHCYAEPISARFSKPGQPFEGLAQFVTIKSASAGKSTAAPVIEARWTGKVRAASHEVLLQPLRWKQPRRIFVNSMSDLFHENLPDSVIDRVFAVMALCPQHTFQILTKRPERMRNYLATAGAELRERWAMANAPGTMPLTQHEIEARLHPYRSSAHRQLYRASLVALPLPNVWLGVSVEDQVTAETRIPYLLDTPAAVRFVSCEPLLGPLDILPFLFIYTHDDDTRRETESDPTLPFNDPATTPADQIASPRLDWVIAGGESGPHARPMHPDWARSLRDQCANAGVPFFFKQWGEWAPSTPEAAKGNPRSGWQCFAGHPHVPAAAELYPEAGAAFIERVGKRQADRLLDGIEHSAFPALPDK